MKTQTIIFLILGLSILLQYSCDDYLDVVPKGKNTLSTLEELETLLNDNHSGGFANFANNLFIITNECYPSYADLLSKYLGERKTLNYGYVTYDEDSVNVDRISLTESDEFYTRAYNKIARYNVVINKINDVAGEDSVKQKLIADAKTLRAYFHWMLANVFAKAYTPEEADTLGGIPYVTDLNFEDINTKLTLKQVYENILDDLSQENLDTLPVIPQDFQRVSKAFAYAVRAKVHLSMKEYDKALQDAEVALSFNDIIEDRKIFIGSSPVRPRNATDNYIYMPGSDSRPIWNAVSAEWMELYEPGDIMRYHTELYEPANRTGIDGSYIWRYGDNYHFNAVGIRTEDMYILKAECLARKNDISGAMNILNTLRQNRIHPDLYQPLTASTTKQAMDHIIRVSKIEFLFTHNNYFNIKRWNTEQEYQQIIKRTVTIATEKEGETSIEYRTFTLQPESTYWLMPFPKNATDYNSTLTQNANF